MEVRFTQLWVIAILGHKHFTVEILSTAAQLFENPQGVNVVESHSMSRDRENTRDPDLDRSRSFKNIVARFMPSRFKKFMKIHAKRFN